MGHTGSKHKKAVSVNNLYADFLQHLIFVYRHGEDSSNFLRSPNGRRASSVNPGRGFDSQLSYPPPNFHRVLANNMNNERRFLKQSESRTRNRRKSEAFLNCYSTNRSTSSLLVNGTGGKCTTGSVLSVVADIHDYSTHDALYGHQRREFNRMFLLPNDEEPT